MFRKTTIAAAVGVLTAVGTPVATIPTANADVSPGVYKRLITNDGYAFDAYQGGVTLNFQTPNKGDYQLWAFESIGGGYYRLRNKHYNQCLRSNMDSSWTFFDLAPCYGLREGFAWSVDYPNTTYMRIRSYNPNDRCVAELNPGDVMTPAPCTGDRKVTFHR